MASTNRLTAYRKKRDFRRTPEPRGRRAGARHGRHFVVQYHDARSRHYDFRLEIDGVLVSWAVPKGPSARPRDKRLAIRTEDHPLDYRSFEGIIPPGAYGAGAVIVWDQGTYVNGHHSKSARSISEQLAAGHLAVRLRGRKLRGGFALTRLARGGRDHWLLVKADDHAMDSRRQPVRTMPESVLSGRTIEEVRSARSDTRSR